MPKPQSLELTTGLKPVMLFLLLLLSPAALLGQNTSTALATTLTVDQFAGNYKGTAKRPTGDIDLTLEIRSENGKAAGRLIAPPHPELQITSGEIVGNKLTLKLSSAANAATLVLQPNGEKLVGEWTSGAQTGAVELKKEPTVAEVLSGEWDAAADVQGQALLFTLTLKVESEKITGGSSSQIGNSTISGGTLKDGKLAFVLDSENGPIAMIATLVDGKLIGDFDFGGQLQGKWVATKRKP